MSESSEIKCFEGMSPGEIRAYQELFQRLGYDFKNVALFRLSMTHRSLQAEGARMDYERLEFLGDAVLDLAIAQLLLEMHPEAKEGELSKMRAALVNTQTLADVARSLSLGEYVRLSRAEIASGGANRDSTLADVFEALIGAVYKESGFEVALKVVQGVFAERVKSVHPNDPKTELQECLHQIGADAPEYLLELVEGPEHAPTFVSQVKVGSEILGKGSGRTKKASQQYAAAEALKNLCGDEELKSRISCRIIDTSANEQTIIRDSNDNLNLAKGFES